MFALPVSMLSRHACRNPGRSIGRRLRRTTAALLDAVGASSEAQARHALLATAGRCEALQPQLAAELRAAGDRIAAR